MEHSEQVEAVKKALDLEKFIAEKSRQSERLSSERFGQAPTPPTKTVIQRTYKPIEPKTKFDWKFALIPIGCAVVLSFILSAALSYNHYSARMFINSLLWLFAVAWIPIYYFVIYKKRKEAEINRIENSAEYKNQRKADDERFDKMQAEADEAYKKQTEEYNNVILPKYQKELNEWTVRQNKKAEELKAELEHAREELQKHYDETKIVPKQYRTVDSLQYIYDFIGTSDYDIKASIEMFDRQEQRKHEAAMQQEEMKMRQKEATMQMVGGIAKATIGAVGANMVAKKAFDNSDSDCIWEEYCTRCGFRGETKVSKKEPHGGGVCTVKRGGSICGGSMKWRRIK